MTEVKSIGIQTISINGNNYSIDAIKSKLNDKELRLFNSCLENEEDLTPKLKNKILKEVEMLQDIDKMADLPEESNKQTLTAEDRATVGALYQNIALLSKDEQVALTKNVATLERKLGANAFAKLSISDIDKEIEKNNKTIEEYNKLEEDDEDISDEQTKANKNAKVTNKAYKELKALLAKHADIAKDVTKTAPEEPGVMAKTGKAIAKTVKVVNDELGIKQTFDAIDKANERVWMRVKDGEYVKAPLQLVGEFGAQATAATAAVGEHINKYPEKGLEAIDEMDEGAGKEVAQSLAAPVKVVASAVNLVSGITNLASWALKGGEYTNEKIDEIVEKTTNVIAEKMLDESDKNATNVQTLFDIRQRLGKTDEELKEMGSDKVKELLAKGVKENKIPRELMLMAYGQLTGEVTMDEKGKLLITDKTAGIDQLLKSAHQFDQGIADALNLPSAVTGALNKGAEWLDEAVSVKDDDSALTAGAKYTAQGVTKTVETATGIVSGAGDMVSGLAKGVWALIPGTETTLKDSGNQIGKGFMDTITGGWWSRSSDSGKATTKELADAEAKQTAGRKQIAKETNYQKHVADDLKARKEKWVKEYLDKNIGNSSDKLLEKMIPEEQLNEIIEESLNAQLPSIITELKAHVNDADNTKEQVAALKLTLKALECIKNPTAANKADLEKIYNNNHPDNHKTADEIMNDIKAEHKKQVKDNMKKGMTALLRAFANKDDAKRLMTLAQNDAQLGKEDSFLKTVVNKIDQAYDQNEFGADKNKFLKFLETTLVDGILLEPFRMIFKESVATTDKALACMVCLNFIGSMVEMAAGTRKMLKGGKEIYGADYNPALLASGESKVAGGAAQVALGVGLSYIQCCSHIILGKHHNSDWLGHKVCCRDNHHVTVQPKPTPKPTPEPTPTPTPDPPTPDPEPWIDDPTL